MGFLEDIVKTIREAAEEAKRRQQQAQMPRPVARPITIEETEIDRKIRERMQAMQGQKADLQATQAARTAKAKRQETTQPILVEARPRLDVERLRSLMRDAPALREAFVLKELLDRPLAMRRGRH